MVKIEYIGNKSPAKVKVKALSFAIKTGDVLDLDLEHAEHLLKNKAFKKVGSYEKKTAKKVEVKKEINYDLDGDGDFDKDDVSIAAKVLAGSRKLKE